MSLLHWFRRNKPVTKADHAKAAIKVLEIAVADKRAETNAAEHRYREALAAAHPDIGGPPLPPEMEGRGRVARALVWLGPRRD